ncbi:hypothetical protein R1sor_008217 [Riccia sorocarpa]|uniref:Uncharacterized protein n=1 Tax=Riccia sorocarpa TaxID=122646 RepID=A0ABD3HUX5_9MARC
METLRGKLTRMIGGGDGRKGDRGGATPPRNLERKYATKNRNYEHNNRRRGGLKYNESSLSDSDSNHSREDPYVFGKASADEIKEICEYLGLPVPQSLGITREGWDASKLPTHSSVLSTESVSFAEEDSSDVTFDVSPPPSHLPPSVRKVLRDADRDFKDSGVGEEQVNNGVSSPSARDADALAGGILGGNNRTEGQDQQQTDSNHSREDPYVFHEYRVLGEASVGALKELCEDLGLPVPQALENYPTHSILESNNVPLSNNLASVHREEPVPRVREVDASSRSSSYSDSSGEFISNYSPRDPSRSPEQRRFNKKQDVAEVKAGTPTKQGSLNRPPPISLESVSPDAFSTHDLLNDLGPDDVSVRRPNVESDSDDDDQVQHPNSSESDNTQTVAFPWTKGELLGAGSFGTVFEAVDRYLFEFTYAK